MSNFIVTFPLTTEKFQEDILNKRFEIGRKIYNSLVTITKNRYEEMVKTKEYRNLILSLKENKKDNKEIYKQINGLRKSYGLTEYSFHKDVINIQKYFKNNIDSHTSQKIATTLWKAYDKFFFGNGKKIHYKKYDSLNSLEGKSNKSGIRFKDNILLWNGLKIPVKINNKNEYEVSALENPISYCRIVRKFIKNKYKFYVQIVFKGIPLIKKNRISTNGDVGIDIGTQTIAVSSSNKVMLLELADKIKNIENEKRKLLRKLDKSRRATNPNNYNSDGTIKKQGNKKVLWSKSNRYVKISNRLKELYRKQADIRRENVFQ